MRVQILSLRTILQVEGINGYLHPFETVASPPLSVVHNLLAFPLSWVRRETADSLPCHGRDSGGSTRRIRHFDESNEFDYRIRSGVEPTDLFGGCATRNQKLTHQHFCQSIS